VFSRGPPPASSRSRRLRSPVRSAVRIASARCRGRPSRTARRRPRWRRVKGGSSGQRARRIALVAIACSSMPPTGLRASPGSSPDALRDGSPGPGPRRTPAGLMDGGHQRRAGSADSEVRRIIVVATAHSPVLVPLLPPGHFIYEMFRSRKFGIDRLRRRSVPVQSRHDRPRRARICSSSR
jgi:hypothetical protein